MKTNWLKDCEICSAGLCAEVEAKKAQGLNEFAACRALSEEAEQLYTTKQILDRYRYHIGKDKKVSEFPNFLAMKDWHETEKSRRFDVESGITVVANLQKDINLVNWAKTEGLFVAIDRSTPWGNPFVIPGDGDRDEVCESYKIYFRLKKSLHKKLALLKGKVIGCHCYPERCHGDFLADQVD